MKERYLKPGARVGVGAQFSAPDLDNGIFAQGFQSNIFFNLGPILFILVSSHQSLEKNQSKVTSTSDHVITYSVTQENSEPSNRGSMVAPTKMESQHPPFISDSILCLHGKGISPIS